ncbi:hypothetical protein ACVGOW_19510 [Pseudonocardia saturnea]
MPSPADPADSVLVLAARLIGADAGSVRRVRAKHRRRADGHCTSCGTTSGPWPCFVLSAAVEADRLAGRATEQQLILPPSSSRRTKQT